MAYKNFKNVSVVCEAFKLKYEEINFIKQKNIKIEKPYIDRLMEFFERGSSFSSEAAISERIIFPIIYEVARIYDFPVWSQQRFDVDKKLKLTGIPDFIIAPGLIAERDFKLPVLCLGEAKKNDFEQGWGQVSAEMYAAQLANSRKCIDTEKAKNVVIYGLVTDGKDWEFGKLEKDKIVINKDSFKAPRELKEVFNSLNWIFCEARKNADTLLAISE